MTAPCARRQAYNRDEPAEAGDRELFVDVEPMRDGVFDWRGIAAVADGKTLTLSPAADHRIAYARDIVEALVARNIRAYGINTGVGALCDVIVAPDQQRSLSRNIVLSHAAGIGPFLPPAETRAIMAAAIANYSNGHAGVRPVLVRMMAAMLNASCLPCVPQRGSVGYISHMAHVALTMIGEGHAVVDGHPMDSRRALERIGLEPVVLESKEGLSLVNGTPCATGLACLALARAERLLDWADAIAALTFEGAGGQVSAFGEQAMSFHRSPGLRQVAERLRQVLRGSARLERQRGARVQDALSLRAVPHVHGAARDAFAYAAGVIDRELASTSDNPLVAGTPEHPEVHSTAHAVGAGVALAMDALAVAVAEVAAMSERRLDRLVNPLVSGLPAFLAEDSGVRSGFMIAQYAAVSLVGENRRLAAPASLDGGVTSGLQEDHLSHATPASLKCLAILDNAAHILGIEWLAAGQASDAYAGHETRAPGTETLYTRLRSLVPAYADDRAMTPDLDRAAAWIKREPCPQPPR